MMRLFTGEDTVLVDVNGHTIHVSKGQGGAEIYINDHATILVHGKHKENPTIIVDSGEYPTKLSVHQTESKWSQMVFPAGSDVSKK